MKDKFGGLLKRRKVMSFIFWLIQEGYTQRIIRWFGWQSLVRNPFRFQNPNLINPLRSQSVEIFKCFYWLHSEYIRTAVYFQRFCF